MSIKALLFLGALIALALVKAYNQIRLYRAKQAALPQKHKPEPASKAVHLSAFFTHESNGPVGDDTQDERSPATQVDEALARAGEPVTRPRPMD